MSITQKDTREWARLVETLTSALQETRRYNDLRMELYAIAADPKIIMTDYLRERLMALATSHHAAETPK